MRDLDDLTCPESKISRDKALNMPIMAIFIKELQVRMDDRTPVDVQGKKLTAGEYAGELLTWLAKRSVCRGFDNDPYAAPRDAILWLYTATRTTEGKRLCSSLATAIDLTSRGRVGVFVVTGSVIKPVALPATSLARQASSRDEQNP